MVWDHHEPELSRGRGRASAQAGAFRSAPWLVTLRHAGSGSRVLRHSATAQQVQLSADPTQQQPQCHGSAVLRGVYPVSKQPSWGGSQPKGSGHSLI